MPAADQLAEIIADFDDFVCHWTTSVETSLCGVSNTTADHLTRREIEQFQREKAAWQRQRQQQLREIEAQAEMLTQAWMQLEAEQRQILRSQHGKPNTHKTTTAHSPSRSRTEESTPAGQQPIHDASRVPSIATARPANHQAPQTNSQAVQQFLQLQREICKHRPPGRNT